MNILITGNLGYVGSELSKFLKLEHDDFYLVGFDNAYFEDNTTFIDNKTFSSVDKQFYGDLRDFPYELLDNTDVLINLAAISNDPIGNKFTAATNDINYVSTKNIATESKKRGVKKFIFASSCSIYGQTNSEYKNESSPLSPLTEYAKSKVMIENELKNISENGFQTTCLRFSTACGMSDRLRLDLVLNDFVASAYLNNQIEILSDGKSWRPLIDVKDMCRAISWAVTRNISDGGNHLTVNVGKNDNNYLIKDLAEIVAYEVHNTEINIKNYGEPDKRSYKVDFSLFAKHAPGFTPQISIEESVKNIYDGLKKINYNVKEFRKSELIRLNKLTKLQKLNKLDENLRWII